MKYTIILTFILFISCYIAVSNTSRVLELTDRFLDIRKDGLWLVMFYAPWCAYCKRLEPVWGHVAQSLYNTNIRVGRLDCTRFTTVATTFSVAGYPTIMFLKGDFEFIFTGDRTKEEMVNFALRLAGPPVQQITRSESLVGVKSTNPVFFVHVGTKQGLLWDTYYDVAEKFQPYGFFYTTTTEIVSSHVIVNRVPAIFVYKEGFHYFFEDHEGKDEIELGNLLHNWVNEERFLTFPKVTKGNIHQMLQTNKYLALAILDENKLQEVTTEHVEFRDMVENVVRTYRDKYHKFFQFGWVGSPDLANSIAMSVLPLPHLIVVNSTTRHHHLPQDDPSQLTPQALVMFLDDVFSQTAPVLGGNAWYVRIYRTYFELRQSLFDMWHGNPILTTVLFGLPMGFLSLICYSICCADIMDADDEEEEELLHEKRE